MGVHQLSLPNTPWLCNQHLCSDNVIHHLRENSGEELFAAALFESAGVALFYLLDWLLLGLFVVGVMINPFDAYDVWSW